MCELQLRSRFQHSIYSLSGCAGGSCGQHQLYSGTDLAWKQFHNFLRLSPPALVVFRREGVTARGGIRRRSAQKIAASQRKGCPLRSEWGAVVGREAQAGPGAEIEKLSSSGVRGRLGREFPSSQPSWDNAKDSVGQPRRPAARCYHGKHPQSQGK